jgi:hypothetical protein
MTAKTLWTLAASAAVLTLALTGCASPADNGEVPSAGQSSSAESAAAKIDVEAAWLDSGRIVGIVTEGSSTCVPSAAIDNLDSGVLEVSLIEAPSDTACTRDMVPRVTLVALPPEADPTQDLKIVVAGEGYTGSVDLDGVAGLSTDGETDYMPSAGWTDEDGQLVVLTWGSSSCAPVVESTGTTPPNEVQIAFVDPPADQACTMDMAPRALVAAVDDDELDDDAEITLVLNGAEFDDVQVPIVG